MGRGSMEWEKETWNGERGNMEWGERQHGMGRKETWNGERKNMEWGELIWNRKS